MTRAYYTMDKKVCVSFVLFYFWVGSLSNIGKIPLFDTCSYVYFIKVCDLSRQFLYFVPLPSPTEGPHHQLKFTPGLSQRLLHCKLYVGSVLLEPLFGRSVFPGCYDISGTLLFFEGC